jgi:hypothetical protein
MRDGIPVLGADEIAFHRNGQEVNHRMVVFRIGIHSEPQSEKGDAILDLRDSFATQSAPPQEGRFGLASQFRDIVDAGLKQGVGETCRKAEVLNLQAEEIVEQHASGMRRKRGIRGGEGTERAGFDIVGWECWFQETFFLERRAPPFRSPVFRVGIAVRPFSNHPRDRETMGEASTRRSERRIHVARGRRLVTAAVFMPILVELGEVS